MRTTRWIAVAALAALCLTNLTSQAQDQQRQDRGNRDGNRTDRGDRGGRNFDPAQMRERMMGYYREQLEINDDTEWKAIEPLIQKVMEARMATLSGRMFGGRGGPGGPGGGGPGGGMFGQASPETDALQKAVDAKASNSELKATLARYTETRKAKQAELEKAQAELRKVLSLRQEAVATLRGLL